MTVYSSEIKHVSSEFEGVYRIKTLEGLILDIPEETQPKIGSHIQYSIVKNSDFPTTLNGIVFGDSENGTLVSFGGLLGHIPLKIKEEEISLSYKLVD